jgi:DNA-binding NarL/FixJ family response regulator
MAARVLIVDDHPLMREGLVELIAGQSDIEVCGEADSAAGALSAIDSLHPDVVVLDLTLGQDDGVALVTTLHSRSPQLPILVLSMHDEIVYAEKMLSLGARGYVMKQEASEVFLIALRKVISGEHYVRAELAARLLSRAARANQSQVPAGQLTAREHEVLRAIARGLSTQEIAKLLGMSAKTVDSHRRNMREKLGLSSAGELVRYAMQWESSAVDSVQKA